jgi:hypothetical protein
VILREQGFEVTNGTAVIAAIPKVGGKYDLKALSELAQSLKGDHPDVDDASVLLEPEIPYDDLIQVMDTIRSADKPAVVAIGEQDQSRSSTGGEVPGEARPERVALFTDIALGDAP